MGKGCGTYQGEVHIGLYWGILKEDIGTGGRLILKWVKKWDWGGGWTGLIWLGTGTDGERS